MYRDLYIPECGVDVPQADVKARTDMVKSPMYSRGIQDSYAKALLAIQVNCVS